MAAAAERRTISAHMARVSRFSPAERQAAVARAFGEASTPAAVARELGVHPTTLYRWADQPADAAEGSASAATERKLVRATQELLRGRDYSEITVEQVASAAGVALRTAFHHFESKRDLFQAAIDDAAARVVAEMTRRAEAEPWPQEPVGQLRTYLRVAAEAAYATSEAHVLFRDLGVPPADGFGQRWHRRFEDALAQLISEVAAADALIPGTDVASAARLLASAMRGLHAAVFEGADAGQAVLLAERLARTVVAGRPIGRTV